MFCSSVLLKLLIMNLCSSTSCHFLIVLKISILLSEFGVFRLWYSFVFCSNNSNIKPLKNNIMDNRKYKPLMLPHISILHLCFCYKSQLVNAFLAFWVIVSHLNPLHCKLSVRHIGSPFHFSNKSSLRDSVTKVLERLAKQKGRRRRVLEK